MKKDLKKIKPQWVSEDLSAISSVEDKNSIKIEQIRYLLKGKSNIIYKKDVERILNS